MRSLGLESRLALWGTRGGFLLVGSGLLLFLLVATVWAGQARLLGEAVEAYAREEADSLARLLLYDLAGDERVLDCRLYEQRMVAMRRADPEVGSTEGLSLGLVAFVAQNLSLPDAVVWDAAVRYGYPARLSDIARARYALYRQALALDREALAEDLSARVTFSDHLRGVRLRSLGGLVDLSAGESVVPRAASVPGRARATFPLYVRAAHWADVTVVVDRSHLEAVRSGLARSLGQLQAGLAGVVAAALAAWGAGWWLLLRNLRRTVVEPVVSLAARMEAWEQEAPAAVPAGDETRWLSEAFDRLLERVRQQREQLLRAQRLGLMERIGAGLSHEINNALNPARLRLDEMMMDGASPSPADLSVLKDHLLAAQRILKDLSLPGRRPAGPPRAIPPGDWLEVARRLVAPHFERGSSLAWAVGADAPAVLGWPEALVEVAVNLLLNARDAAAARAGGGRVAVTLAVSGAAAELVVADNGPGIPPEVRAHLGEPFVTSKPEGAGLGLFVTDMLVRRMGGALTFDEAPGGGTAVRVRLPRAEGERDGRGS